MEDVLTRTADYLLRQSWQIAAVFVLVAAGCWALRKASSHWRYLLWLVVLAKCLVPPLVIVPLAILPQAEADKVVQPPAPPAAPALAEHLPAGMIERPPPAWPGEPGVLDPAEPPLPPAPVPPAAEPVAAIEAARPADSPAMPPLTFAQWAAVGWVAGAGAFVLYAFFKAAWIQRRLKRTREPAGDALRAQVAQLAGRLGLHSAPRVWLWDGIGQPFVWGLLRGDIYLPKRFGQGGSPGHRVVLAHELAHVTRWDAAVNALQVVVQGMFFFHPLVWWANRKVRQEREKCCDETAIAVLSARPSDYGRAIVDALLARRESTRPVPSLAIAGPVRNIEARIKTIMARGRGFRRRPTWLAVVSVLLLAAVAVPTGVLLTARAEEAAEPAGRCHWGSACGAWARRGESATSTPSPISRQ